MVASRNPLRILLVAAANATTGGGERHTADLARGLADRGFELGIAAPAGGDLARIAAEIGATYFPVPLDGALCLGTIRQLRGVIERFAPDLVHAQGARAAAFARPADSQAAKRLIYTVHGIHADRGAARFFKLAVERALRRRTARFITVCAADKEHGSQLRILDPQHTRVVYNGIAVHTAQELQAKQAEAAAFWEEAGAVPGATLLLHVGRISPQKNQPQLLEAFAALLPQAPQAVLALISAGTDEQQAALQSQIDQLGLAGSARLLSPRPDLTAAYLAADLFVLPSLWEGFPYVLIEAADAGCAIVTTDVGGNREAIMASQEGWLVKPDDQPALTAALIEALESPDQRHQRAIAAKLHVDTAFTLEAMVEQTIALYEDLIQSTREERDARA